MLDEGIGLKGYLPGSMDLGDNVDLGRELSISINTTWYAVVVDELREERVADEGNENCSWCECGSAWGQ